MLNPLGILPLHLACQFLVSQNNFTLVNVNLDTSIPKLSTELPDGYTVFLDVGIAYKYYETQIPWNAARKYCGARGASLAVVDSYEKIGYLQSIRTQERDVHVGIHRLFDSTEWTDIKTGLPAAAIPWRSISFEEQMDRKCGALTFNSAGVYAQKCELNLSFFCEVPIFKN